MNRRGLFYVLLVAALVFSVPAFAQRTSGDITGTVTDATGAIVVGAAVTAVNKETNVTRSFTTNETGLFRFAELAPGVYKVTATANGFKSTERDVQVAIGQVTTADFGLQVGQRTDTVTVEAAAPLVEYSPNLNNYLGESLVERLPLSGRDFNTLLEATPGVYHSPGGGFLAVTISGARSTSNNYLIDGMYNNDRFYGDSALNQTGVIGIPATLIPIDSIQEFTVSQLPSAEYGVKGGASINVSLKSGANELHGSGFYFGHWDRFDAANGLAKQLNNANGTNFNPKTKIFNHQYGGTLGGPIVKDKTFFYGFFEGQRNESKPIYSVGVPTPGEILLARQKIAAAGLTTQPGGEALLSLYPTDPSGFLLPDTTISARMSSYGIKLDHKISDKHQLSGRYILGDSQQSAPSIGYTITAAATNTVGLNPDAFNSVAPSRAQLIGVSWTYAASPTKILESRFGATRFAQILEPNNKIDPVSLGLDTGPLDPADFGVPYVYMSYVSYGYIGGVSGYPITTRPNQTLDQSEHFTWIKGNHTMKMGGNWQYAYSGSIRNRARSSLSVLGYFDPTVSTALNTPYYLGYRSDQIAALLLLRFDRAARSFGDTTRTLKQHSLGLYWQDEWKIVPRVTLSFGLRYDIYSALGEKDNLGGNFDLTRGLVSLGSDIDALHSMDKNNFGPRAGFAWDVFGNGKTALRAGYALTYDNANFAVISAAAGASYNGTRAAAFTNPNQGVFSRRVDGNGSVPAYDPTATCGTGATLTGDYICGGAGRLLFGATPTASVPFGIFGVDPNLRTPYYHYYSLGLQHELFKNNVVTITYIGSKGDELLMYRDLNARPLGCFAGGQLAGPGCERPFQNAFPTATFPGSSFNSIVQLTNDSYSNYNSFQFSYRMQNFHGFTTQTNWTWGHCLDLNSANRSGRTGNSPSQNPYDAHANKGNCGHDIRHNANFNGTYDFPKVESMGRFGDGWQTGASFLALSGPPFTAGIGSRDRSGQNISGVQRADCIQAPIYDTRNPVGYISNESTAFGDPGQGLLGTCGRNSLRGHGFAQLDVNITKVTRITEKVRFQFRWEVFNVLNRTNFGNLFATNVRFGGVGNPTTTPDASQGNPVIAKGGPRAMQFVFKVQF